MPSLVETLVPVFRCRMVPLSSMDQVMHTESSTSSTSSLHKGALKSDFDLIQKRSYPEVPYGTLLCLIHSQQLA